MKQLLQFKPNFLPATQQVDFSNWPGFTITKLYAIINVTQNAPIYVAGAPGLGATSTAGSVITLAYNTTTHSTSDVLNIYYETAPGWESNTPRETGGQLQQIQETLNQLLIEMQVQSLILAQGLNINIDDVTQLRNDFTNPAGLLSGTN